jgi:hypothetical protein
MFLKEKRNIQACVEIKQKRSSEFQSSNISLTMVGIFLGMTKMEKLRECQMNGSPKKSNKFSETIIDNQSSFFAQCPLSIQGIRVV